jgi:hypothetical protein
VQTLALAKGQLLYNIKEEEEKETSGKIRNIFILIKSTVLPLSAFQT